MVHRFNRFSEINVPIINIEKQILTWKLINYGPIILFFLLSSGALIDSSLLDLLRKRSLVKYLSVKNLIKGTSSKSHDREKCFGFLKFFYVNEYFRFKFQYIIKYM